MTKVVELPTRQNEVKADVTKILEDMLELARQGRFEGVAFSAITYEGDSFTIWSTTSNAQGLLGAMRICEHRFMAKVIQT